MRVPSSALWLALALAACRGARGEPSSEAIDPRQPPLQRAIEADVERDDPPRARGGATFVPRARYRIAARVLSRERYYLGWKADLAPLDLALGWGAISDASVDEWIDWHQGGRWYFWQWSAGSPYQNDAIHTQSANVHIVPANENLRSALLAVDRNELVQLTGWLVDIVGPDGDRWHSSLSRTDTGNNSCELMYVTQLDRDGTVYR